MTSNAIRAGVRSSLVVLVTTAWGAAAALGGVEIGGSDAAPPPDPGRHAPAPEVRFGPTFGWLFLTDQSMSETYSTMAMPSLVIATDIADGARFVMGAGYGFAHGNPFSGVTGFEGDDEAELTAIPLQIGLQSDISPHPRLHILCGLSAELVWMRERLPFAAVAGSADHEDFDGWGSGLRFTFGPELRSADAGRVVGFAMGWGVSGGEVSGRGRHHEVNLTGVGVQCHVLWRL
jgi:hypothetical protein